MSLFIFNNAILLTYFYSYFIIDGQTCTQAEFNCDNQCFSKILLCDGYKHCLDGSDENENWCKVWLFLIYFYNIKFIYDAINGGD